MVDSKRLKRAVKDAMEKPLICKQEAESCIKMRSPEADAEHAFHDIEFLVWIVKTEAIVHGHSEMIKF